MRVILFRHGPAGERDPLSWPDDRARPLTPRGAERTLAAARGVGAMESRIDHILSSPLERALATAKLLATGVEHDGEVEILESLSPGGSWRTTEKALSHYGELERVVLVGHEPELGKLAGVFLFGAPSALPLKKAGGCAIEFESHARAGTGALRWFLPPRALRRLAGRGRRSA